MPRYIWTILIWGSIVLGGLVGLVVAAFLVLSYFGESRLNQTYEIQPAAITVPTGDDEAIERGRHLTVVTGICTECHGENFQGDVIADDALCCRLARIHRRRASG